MQMAGIGSRRNNGNRMQCILIEPRYDMSVHTIGKGGGVCGVVGAMV